MIAVTGVEPLPDLLRLTGRQQAAIDCAVCGRRLGVHVRLLGEVDDRHGHVLLLAACAVGCAPLVRPVPAAPPPRRPWRPPPGVRLPASARLPRWPYSDPTPPVWQTATARDEVTLQRVLDGLRSLPDSRPSPG